MIRDIRKLDGVIKKEYCLILAGLMKNLEDVDVFQMKAFYKMMAYIQVPKKHRKEVIDFLIEEESQEWYYKNEIESLLTKVKGQERDILRFTLMQDIIEILTANDYVPVELENLLKELQLLLKISDEQRVVFEESLSSSELNITNKKVDRKEIIKRELSKYIALGIPLGLLYYSPHNAFRHSFKSFALLQIDKKINQNKLLYSLGKYVVLGGLLYKGINWGLNQKYKNSDKLEKMLMEESKQLKNLGRKYLEEDLAYCEKTIGKKAVKNQELRLNMIMEKTLKYMDR